MRDNIVVNLKFKRNQDVVTIAGTSCWHLDAPWVFHEGIERFKKRVLDGNLLWVHHGDLVDSVILGDRRYRADAESKPLLDAMVAAKIHFEPIRHLCMGLNEGNHEWECSRYIGNLAKNLALEKLKVPYLSYIAFLELKCPDGKLTAVFGHAARTIMSNSGPYIRRKANERVRLVDIWQYFKADLIGCGHYHKSIVAMPTYIRKLALRKGKVRQVLDPEPHGVYYAAPSMFRGYDTGQQDTSYVERAMYPPTEMGWVEVDIRRDGMIVEVRECPADGSPPKVSRPEYAGNPDMEREWKLMRQQSIEGL